MNMNQNLNINGSIMEKDANGLERSVVSITASFTNQQSFTLGFNILDSSIVTNNKENVQLQFNEFLAAMKGKMMELGYEITI